MTLFATATDIVPDIPDRFWKIPYDVAHDRDSPTLMGIETGANCQNFAYELLRYFGRPVPFLRSSNLWDDTEHTIVVDTYQPLDLLLFNRTHDAWGAHVAVYVGNDRAIHLGRRIGLAAVWPLAQFATHPEYGVLLGGKRTLSTDLDRSLSSSRPLTTR
jgi:lipoprotein Spr